MAAIATAHVQGTPERCGCGARKKRVSMTCLACYRAARLRSPSRPASARFLGSVDSSGGPLACWPWLGHIERNGYGRFFLEGRSQWAHRAAYQLFVGPIPAGCEMRHRCDNPPCCNPAHLLPGTRLENVGDAIERGRAARGERSGTAKLTTDQVVALRVEYAAGGVLMREIAARLGVSDSTIKLIVRRERWAHV